MIDPLTDEHFMKKALMEAQFALEKGEVPVGVVVVAHGQIIARGHNLTETLTDVTAHAEMQAITAAANYIGGKYLKDCTLYVTLEPCTMCCGALVHARVSNLIFAAREPRAGAVVSAGATLDHAALNHRVAWQEGLLSDQSAALLQQFFKARRIDKPQS